MMNVTTGLVAFAITAVLVFLFLIYYGIKTWSALVFALAIGLLVMFIVTPISSVDEIMQGEPEYGVFIALIIIVSLIVLIYLVEQVFRDKVGSCQCQDGGRLIPLS